MENHNLSEDEHKRIVIMLDEWEAVRAGANALRIIGEIVKWVLGVAVTILAVVGFQHGNIK